MLDRFEELAEDQEKIPVGDLMDAVGRRSFGPLLLMAGIVMAAPGISDIPGVPTLTGIFVLIVCVQILCGREDFWLPGWLLRCKISQKLLKKLSSSTFSRGAAKGIDRFVTERLEFLAGPGSNYMVAAVCTALAVLSPLTELVPLSGIGVGMAFVAFGISLVARDGLMTLIGFAISAVTIGLAIMAKF